MTSQINACQAGVFPTMVEDDEEESPHMHMDKTDEEMQDTCPAFVENFTIEEDDHVFMAMVHLVNPHHFVCALSMVFRCLAEVFAKNSKLRGFECCANVITHIC
jgi:hypothetical protein